MYNLIGGDGRQYGPVSAEQVREWIAAGRTDARTSAQRAGETEWRPLSAFPEFAEALAAGRTPAAQPPPPASSPPPSSASSGGSSLGASASAEALAREILARDYRVEPGRYLSRAWALYTADFWSLLGISTLIWVLWWTANSTTVGLVLSGPLEAGLYWYFLKRIRGQKAEVEDAFAGFTANFLQTMLTGLVGYLLIALGLLLCLAPGIYLLVAWWPFALPLVMDRRLQFWDALEVSRKVVTRHWWSWFGFFLVTLLINFGGLLVCGVGVFVTLPLTTLAWMYAYEDVFGQSATEVRPAGP